MRRALVSVAILAAGLAVGACGGDSESNRDAGPIGDASAADSGGEADAQAARARKMYVTTGGLETLAVIQLEADGTMTALSALDVSIPGAVTGSMAYARTARRLYVGAGASVRTLSLDAAGAPTLLGSSPMPGVPTFISLVNDEAHIATAYFGDDVVAVHDVTGPPPHAEADSLETDVQPHAALLGPGGLIYVPHRDGGVISWFSVTDGELELVDEIASAEGVGPRHIAFTPDEAFAYVVNEQGDSVTAYSVGASGSLTALETITTLPVGGNGAINNCADVHVTPDGQFVYASNRGDNSIAMFSIGSDGNLSALGVIPTEATPREFDISPDGRYLVALGQDSGFLQSYAIGGDGRLTPIADGVGVGRLEVGGSPLWAIID